MSIPVGLLSSVSYVYVVNRHKVPKASNLTTFSTFPVQLLGKEEEGSEDSSEEDWSDYSEETDSEEEGPRLKPVFVRKKDRITIHQKEQQQLKAKQVRSNINGQTGK